VDPKVSSRVVDLSVTVSEQLLGTWPGHMTFATTTGTGSRRWTGLPAAPGVPASTALTSSHVGSLVGARSVLYTVYGLQRSVQSRIHPYGRVGAEDVVVYCGQDSHNLGPTLFLQPQRPGEASLPAYDHQPFHTCLLQPPGRKVLAFRSHELRRTSGSKHRPARWRIPPTPRLLRGWKRPSMSPR
jgi:hypothetical protein